MSGWVEDLVKGLDARIAMPGMGVTRNIAAYDLEKWRDALTALREALESIREAALRDSGDDALLRIERIADRALATPEQPSVESEDLSA